MLQPISVKLVDRDGQILFDTAMIHPESYVHRTRRCLIPPASINWKVEVQSVPVHLGEDVVPDCRMFDGPFKDLPDLLSVTRHKTDYCFYCAKITTSPCEPDSCSDSESDSEPWVILRMKVADMARVFINGELVASAPEDLYEDRFNNQWNNYGNKAPGFRAKARFKMPKYQDGDCQLTIMTCSLGMIKGDWQLGEKSNMLKERKGLLAHPTIDYKSNNGYIEWHTIWEMYPGTRGDRSLPSWNKNTRASKRMRLEKKTAGPTYYSATIRLDKDNIPQSVVLDLKPMTKGLIWVNEILLGRYWLVSGHLSPTGFLKGSRVRSERSWEPTQRYYHIPRWVIDQSGDGTIKIVLFDEVGRRRINDVELLMVE